MVIRQLVLNAQTVGALRKANLRNPDLFNRSGLFINSYSSKRSMAVIAIALAPTNNLSWA
jgi:hypothetical protein